MQVSIVIPTRDRVAYLRRLLRFYEKRDTRCPIIIADSSEQPDAIQKCVAESQLPLKLQSFAPDINLYKKLHTAIDGLTTPYVAMCGDDDFLVPDTVSACADFLTTHTDYAVAAGHAVVFTQDGETITTRSYPQIPVTFDNPLQRLQAHFADYSPTFYTVHRRENLLRNLRIVQENTHDYTFGELLHSGLNVIQGKFARLNLLYMVRQNTTQSAGKSKSVFKAGVLSEDDQAKRYKLFRDSLAAELGMSELRGVDEAFKRYLILMANNSCSTIQTIVDGKSIAVKPSASAYVHRFIRTVRRKMPFPALFDPMAIQQLLKPTSLFYADFLPIYESITEQKSTPTFS